MKILVVGSGGREHAIAWALRKSAPDLKLYCAPGNAGIAEVAECVPIAVGDADGLVQFASSAGVSLTVVGPEMPLAGGLVDLFEANNLRIFGPLATAARLESSKSFAKNFMARHGIPTARYKVARSCQEAFDILRTGEFGRVDSSVVIKADGLAAGKGVIIAKSSAEAEKAIDELAVIAGGADKPLIIEEALEGREASVLVFADGRDYAIMPPARDHKRIGENETGPNTGGMGSITAPTIVDEATLRRVTEQIIEPTLEGARKEGFPFSGVLFFGLMLTSDGPKVLEYNVRFGDPETQAILVRLESSLLSLLEATIVGTIRNCKVEWSEGASACVILANRGYPGKYETGATIEGLEQGAAESEVQIFHSGTARSSSGALVTSGGRVLGITATGTTLDESLTRCYAAAEKISWEGMQYRRDIGRMDVQRPTSKVQRQKS